METKTMQRVKYHATQAERLLTQVLNEEVILSTKTAELTDAAQTILLFTRQYAESNTADIKDADIINHINSVYITLSNANECFFDTHLDADDCVGDGIDLSAEAAKVFQDVKSKLGALISQIGD